MAVRVQEYHRLGQELVRRGLLGPHVLVEAIRAQKRENRPLPEVLTSMGIVGVEDLLAAMGDVLGMPVVNLREQRVDPAVIKHVPEALARRHRLIPVALKGNTLQVAMANPEDLQALGDLRAQAGLALQVVLANPAQIEEAINLHYKATAQIAQELQAYTAEKGGAATATPAPAQAPDEETPVVRALDLILLQAIRDRASDIHVEPQPDRLRVRYRIDGVLQEAVSLSADIHPPLVSRIKILGRMNIAERRLPQDGQFTFRTPEKEVDIRVATAETAYGERVVMRLLDKTTGLRTLPELGFLPDALARYQEILRVPHGILLIAGPTGSGKTTTLYASIQAMDSRERNIITIEDPVEYRFPDVSQIQVNLKAGLTFAGGLRAIMRHDPDVILVGEIRDGDTANTAVQASLTGHLVLSSIHANDTEGVIYRLMNLGVDPYLVVSSLVGVVAQRMVRRVCSNCAESKEGTPEEQRAYEEALQEKRTHFHYGRGCQSCGHTGYRGRTGVFEIMPITQDLQRLIMAREEPGALRQKALEQGMVSMFRDGLMKVRDGVTNPSEVLRNLYSLR